MTNKERNRLTDAHWDAVWARLRAQGRVDVPVYNEPYCPSSCAALDAHQKNPGASRNILVVMQSSVGSGGGE